MAKSTGEVVRGRKVGAKIIIPVEGPHDRCARLVLAELRKLDNAAALDGVIKWWMRQTRTRKTSYAGVVLRYVTEQIRDHVDPHAAVILDLHSGQYDVSDHVFRFGMLFPSTAADISLNKLPPALAGYLRSGRLPD